MTVVYIDMLFLLNLVANYLLLLVTGRMSGNLLRRWLLVLSAALGALYASLTFFPGFGWLSSVPCKLGAAVLMVVVAYGGGKRLLRTTLTFFGASAALGGMVWAVELMGGHSLTMNNGVLYSYLDLRLLLLLLILCYGILTFVANRTFQHKSAELAQTIIQVGQQELRLTALLDTGNTLTDPVTNRPVLVAEGACCETLFPMKLPLNRPVTALESLDEIGVKGYRLLPYRAVGVESGMLLALKADRVVVGQRDYGSILVALSPTPVSDGGRYQALIGGTL